MKEKAEILSRIKEEILATQQKVIDYRELTKPIAPENAIGRISRMDAINNKTINEAALRKAELRLNNLQIALSKIDDSDFGICRKCQQQIPLGRIILIPHVTLCVQCAT